MRMIDPTALAVKSCAAGLVGHGWTTGDMGGVVEDRVAEKDELRYGGHYEKMRPVIRQGALPGGWSDQAA